MSAYEIIQRYSRQAPVDIEGFARELGVKIIKADMEDAISGEIIKSDDGDYVIRVNANHPATRQRFTIAHELGHYILHKNLLGKGVNDNKAYRTTQQSKFFNPNIGSYQETEANRFAASLLMPGDLVISEMAKDFSVEQLAEKFKVSKLAMEIRVDVLNRSTR
jgi:Zn-dependent peptidase ImmA (M78 family)